MSHSRVSNVSADLEHLELTEEVLAAAAADSHSEASSPILPRSNDSRRVSINSNDSSSSASTIKYHPSASTGGGGGMSSSSSNPRLPSSGSYAGAVSNTNTSSSRPKPSYRHSSALLSADNAASNPPPTSMNRRRNKSYSSKRPGSSRSSIRQRNLSEEEDDGEGGYNHRQHDWDDERPNPGFLRSRAGSRRSVRVSVADEEEEEENGDDGQEYNSDEDEGNSDDEPLTLKDRQETLNQTHPFGLPLWKPALYKKSRSVIRKANSALHSQPSSELYLSFGNLLWTIVFGWWMSISCLTMAILLYLVPFGGRNYGRVVLGLSFYLIWPFGQYVEREFAPGEARGLHGSSSYSEDTTPVSPNLSRLSPGDESRPLLSRSSSMMERERQQRPRATILETIRSIPSTIYDLGLGGVVYYFFYYTSIGPMHLIVSCLCWFMVVSIPMAKFSYVLATHLHQHPLRLNFKRGSSLTLSPMRSEILLCTYDAIGLQYYKYTYDGTNIIFINLMPVVFFTILDDYVLTHVLGHDSILTQPATIFGLGLASVIPLSYFIGMAVSSISAQSSLGMGAVINATFGSIIEIILYTVALSQGKGLITEGALIGSFLAGLLLMPGMSMLSGAIKKKEQKFNAKSAGVTATMLIMSLIGVLTPSLFYQIFGRFELRCEPCPENVPIPIGGSCNRCYHHQPNPADDVFFQLNVKPLMYFCCIILPSAYLIGIWFSLRTHVKQIWHEPPKPAAPDMSLYKKLLPSHIVQQLLHLGSSVAHHNNHAVDRPSGVDAEMGTYRRQPSYQSTGNNGGIHHAASATSGGGGANGTIHPAAQGTHHTPGASGTGGDGLLTSMALEHDATRGHHEFDEEDEEEGHGGHDSPNWSKFKSATVLLSCTVLYSIIAEILVDSVDAVSSIDEKLLGLTLFALVPNVTEFMNAIAFAMYGNIALSMEIGSAYALQVCLIQIPAMVVVSAYMNMGKEQLWKFTFNMIFPRWDVFAMLFSVFLLTYTYIEGKSNYFKGSILILSYCVLMAGYYYAPASLSNGDVSFF